MNQQTIKNGADKLQAIRGDIAEFNKAAKKAAESVRTLYAKARAAAQEFRDGLLQFKAETSKARRFCDIIERAIRERTKEVNERQLQSYELAVNQFVTACLSTINGVSCAQLTNGTLILQAVNTHKQIGERERMKVLEGLVLGAIGKVDLGLIKFPSSFWGDGLKTEQAEALALMVDPGAVNEYFETMKVNSQQLATAQRFLDGLAQAEPRIFTVDESEPGESFVEIKNTRPGLIGVGGIEFNGGGAITRLTSEEFNRIRDAEFFKAHVKTGNLHIVSSNALAKAV